MARSCWSCKSLLALRTSCCLELPSLIRFPLDDEDGRPPAARDDAFERVSASELPALQAGRASEPGVDLMRCRLRSMELREPSDAVFFSTNGLCDCGCDGVLEDGTLILAYCAASEYFGESGFAGPRRGGDQGASYMCCSKLLQTSWLYSIL